MKRNIKKKSKYRHVVVGKKKYYFYTIKWYDILGNSGHSDFNEMKKMEPAIMVTQAYVFEKNKKKVVTFASHDINEESFSDSNSIPIGCIISMKKAEI